MDFGLQVSYFSWPGAAASIGPAFGRIARNADGALEGLNGHYVPFGESFILLAGPVGSKNAMDELVGKLAEKGMGALPYTSSEGQEVQRLK